MISIVIAAAAAALAIACISMLALVARRATPGPRRKGM